ncbi:anthranilate phosphoribosyltransferase [Sphingomonas sp. S17]|uniref:Anthranilate phosphoribosyltransferase n=2 Tax=Sphingomonas paucimobilis TaxID=13689 RepID=A0A411LGY3_SPHPI|nr:MULTISPECIES: anthranilate phosphoribosyltransferase [Sphingomonas]EGI56095.1 anthranilate phosphoribosyltransferase [Sphingomonas sp. S17]MBQ1481432.1 anthranilate phosphoribosyltransferase [Sphingomonas sp.]MCM3677664.1 anthranilate phosphoribosyltransferase [Sphingomonas paucimobilis]MDG5972291.1 anthranilate phosphoribosyltransferase [Sphingomonas paucimobilis]NNG57730.1 anthranilate phosphoribosyltransferase [Sphingomonas paucimobilis]
MTTTTLLPDTISPLSRESAAAAFADILDGRAGEDAIAAFLIGLTERGETSIEIAEAARAMRQRVIPIEAPAGTIDVCGTGGDGHHTLNVSTAVSLVVASLGVPVAKHGNRAASSKAGAADTLEVLGLDMQRAGEMAQASLTDIGIAFLFAANHHPAMARITPIRKQIGRRTIFNLMGPLANPAHVGRQLIGIARPDYAPVYAEALEQLGAEAALVVSGEEGLDELSGAGPSITVSVGRVTAPRTITPEDAGLPRHPITAIRGGDARHNAEALRRLLAGEPGAYRDAVLLNAAAALLVAGHSADLAQGAVAAARAIDSGAAAALLDQWIAYR